MNLRARQLLTSQMPLSHLSMNNFRIANGKIFPPHCKAINEKYSFGGVEQPVKIDHDFCTVYKPTKQSRNGANTSDTAIT